MQRPNLRRGRPQPPTAARLTASSQEQPPRPGSILTGTNPEQNPAIMRDPPGSRLCAATLAASQHLHEKADFPLKPGKCLKMNVLTPMNNHDSRCQ